MIMGEICRRWLLDLHILLYCGFQIREVGALSLMRITSHYTLTRRARAEASRFREPRRRRWSSKRQTLRAPTAPPNLSSRFDNDFLLLVGTLS